MRTIYRNGKWRDEDGKEIVPGLRERLADRSDRAIAGFRTWCYRNGIPRILWEPRTRMAMPALAGSLAMKYGGNYNVGKLQEMDAHNAEVDRNMDAAAEEATKKQVSELVRSGALDKLAE